MDILGSIEEIAPSLRPDTLLVSLNGNISFEMIGRVTEQKVAKVIPSLTAEINRSQSLVCYTDSVTDEDKVCLKKLLSCIGNVIELPEKEMGMGSELVSCMPGFIASIFDVICKEAKKHTEIPEEQIVGMVLSTLSATGDLMLQKEMTFEEVVKRVATKGGITQEGTAVVYEKLPDVADELFEKTLAKRRLVAEKANIVLKPVERTEIETLWKMQVAAFSGLLEKYRDYDTSPAAEGIEKVSERYEQPWTTYFFIVAEDKKVGAVRVVDKKDGSRKRISPLWIMPEYRNKGYAQQAILAVEKIYGSDHWCLDTILQEEGNLHLYEKLGYRRMGTVDRINDRMDIVYFIKD